MASHSGTTFERARFGGLRLWRNEFQPGALLPLREAPRTSGRHTDPSLVEVEARQRVKAVVVRNLTGSEPQELVQRALDYANPGLDLLCVSGIAPMVIADPQVLNMCWWLGTGELRCLRVTCRARLQARMSVGGGIHDADDPGNMIFAPTATTWDPAMRHFRLSQVTDDLFDAFRNLYLSVECVLDAILPRQKGMREGEWLRLALQSAANKGVDLNKYALPGSGSAENRLYQEIWTDVRNAVFHAKGSQTRFLPLDASTRPAVQDAHLRLGALFMDLADRELGVHFLSSGIGIAVAGAMAGGVLSDTQIMLSASRASLDANGNVTLPDGPSVSATTRSALELDDDWTRFVVASFMADQIAVMPPIQSLILIKHGAIHAFEEFEGSDLTLENIDRFEVAFGVELGGVSLRSSYPS